MNTSIYFQRGPSIVACSIADAVIVEFEGYDTYQFKRDGWFHRTPAYLYKWACRFVRLIERGYSPKRALYLADSPDGYQWKNEMVHSLHDKLTDDIPPVVPEGYSIETFCIDELATSELKAIMASWYRDGDEALFLASEEYSVDYNEIRAYVHGVAQHEDEENGSWVLSHHTSNYSY